MIGGFILGAGRGNGSASVVVRALGPSLSASNVSNPLQDPTLELHNATGAIIATNDDWSGDPGAAQIQGSGLAPADLRESATLQTLLPGNYTVIVRGKNNTTGVGLVEAYNLQ
jgi:hypothetical protein